MYNDASSSLIQDWYVINDGRWAYVIGTRVPSSSE